MIGYFFWASAFSLWRVSRPAPEPVDHGDMTVIDQRHVRAIRDAQRPDVLDDAPAEVVQRLMEEMVLRQKEGA